MQECSFLLVCTDLFSNDLNNVVVETDLEAPLTVIPCVYHGVNHPHNVLLHLFVLKGLRRRFARCFNEPKQVVEEGVTLRAATEERHGLKHQVDDYFEQANLMFLVGVLSKNDEKHAVVVDKSFLGEFRTHFKGAKGQHDVFEHYVIMFVLLEIREYATDQLAFVSSGHLNRKPPFNAPPQDVVSVIANYQRISRKEQ